MHISSLSVKQDLPWKVEKEAMVEERILCGFDLCRYMFNRRVSRTRDSAVNGRFYEPLKLVALFAEDQQVYARGEYGKQQDQDYQDDL